MMNHKEYDEPVNPQKSERPGNAEEEHVDQFNELSELSLEERMNVADQIGIPVHSLGEAAALGTVRDRDEAADRTQETTDEDGNIDESV